MTISVKQTTFTAVKAIGIAALLSAALITNASAEDARIKSTSFSIQPVYQGDEIIVTSSDGKKWDTIDSKALKLSVTMKVITKGSGYVDGLGVFLGVCSGTGCKGRPLMFAQYPNSEHYNKNKTITFSGSRFPVSTNGIAVPNYGDAILNSCNNGLLAGGTTKTHKFKKLIDASFSANTRKGHIPPTEVREATNNGYPNFNGGDVNRKTKFTVRVTCKQYLPPRVPPLVLKKVYFKVVASKKCPVDGVVQAEFITSKAGKINFKLIRYDGNHQDWSISTKKQNNGQYRATWVKTYKFTKSVSRKYMIIVKSHKYSSKWKPMVVKCGAKNNHKGPDGLTKGGQPTYNKKPLVYIAPKQQKKPTFKRPTFKRPLAKPTIKVAPLRRPIRRVVCRGGKVSGNKCFCPARHKKLVIRKNAYRCVQKVALIKKFKSKHLGKPKTRKPAKVKKFKRKLFRKQ